MVMWVVLYDFLSWILKTDIQWMKPLIFWRLKITIEMWEKEAYCNETFIMDWNQVILGINKGSKLNVSHPGLRNDSNDLEGSSFSVIYFFFASKWVLLIVKLSSNGFQYLLTKAIMIRNQCEVCGILLYLNSDGMINELYNDQVRKCFFRSDKKNKKS